MEGWAKVWLAGSAGQDFIDSIHGRRGCVGCHGGLEGEHSKADAHTGLIADPSEGRTNRCNDYCHGAEGYFYHNSVHSTQAGYVALLEERGQLELSEHPELMAGFDADCAACHASCGDCHISSPKNVGGGLVEGHRVLRTPDSFKQCTPCHGSRIGDEYRGLNAYASADVHWIPNLMDCVDCHSGDEMHGDATRPQHRYEVAQMPQCEDCHQGLEESNAWHAQHFDELQCNVCHSQSYKSCNACHVGEGISGSSYPTFKIGRNPIPELRDARFVLLRHIPVADDTFAGWGLEGLPGFIDEPTWKYTSPHNIRRFTAVTDTTGGRGCEEACHLTEDSPGGFFLRASDLEGLPAVEREANQALTVPEGPPTEW